MSRSGSAAGIIVSVLIVAAVGSIGFYQFVVVPNLTNTSSGGTTSSTTIKPVRINITVGASTKTNDAYAPNPITLVIGKNNSVIFFNVDIQGGVGVAHTGTARTNVGGKPVFDTGILMEGESSNAFPLNTPGTYDYFCLIHPTTMRGTIIVVAG